MYSTELGHNKVMNSIHVNHQNMHFRTVNKNLRMTALHDWRKLVLQDRGHNPRNPHLFVVKFQRQGKAYPMEVLEHTIRIYQMSPLHYTIEWETSSTKNINGNTYVDIVKGVSSDKNKEVDMFLYGLYSNFAAKKELNESEQILNSYLDSRFRHCEQWGKIAQIISEWKANAWS